MFSFNSKEKKELLNEVEELKLKVKDSERFRQERLDDVRYEYRKEKKELEIEYEEREDALKKQLKECKGNRELAIFDQKIISEEECFKKLSERQQEHLVEVTKLEANYREEAIKTSKLETEMSILKAEVEVLRRLEDKSDEYKDAIHVLELQLKDKGNEYAEVIKSLELQVANKTARIELMNEKSARDEKEITELKVQLKEANDRIFAFTTKEPIIVRPEILTPTMVSPTVIEPVVLHSKK